MTEKEKMLNGLMYYAGDPELAKERLIAKEMCYDLNHLRPSQDKERKEILQKILGKSRNKFSIVPPFWCDYGYNIEIGENFFANYNLIILDCAKVIFGNNVFVGPDCSFYTASHPMDVESRNAKLEYAQAISIGDNVWIGGGVKVLPGIRIGDNVVIGGGSVVTKNIPDNSIAVGNPCKVVRKTE